MRRLAAPLDPAPVWARTERRRQRRSPGPWLAFGFVAGLVALALVALAVLLAAESAPLQPRVQPAPRPRSAEEIATSLEGAATRLCPSLDEPGYGVVDPCLPLNPDVEADVLHELHQGSGRDASVQ